MRKGVPVSPGVAVARAYCVDPILTRNEPTFIEATNLTKEVRRFELACAAAARDLEDAAARIGKQVGEEEAAIFRAHRALLRDPALFNKVASVIHSRQVDAATALHLTVEEYASLFDKLGNSHLRERFSDLRDVVERVVSRLAAKEQRPLVDSTEPIVLVAPEILPSHAVGLDRAQIAGILTEKGGATGHVAILARALGIPAVSGVQHLMRDVKA